MVASARRLFSLVPNLNAVLRSVHTASPSNCPLSKFSLSLALSVLKLDLLQSFLKTVQPRLDRKVCIFKIFPILVLFFPQFFVSAIFPTRPLEGFLRPFRIKSVVTIAIAFKKEILKKFTDGTGGVKAGERATGTGKCTIKHTCGLGNECRILIVWKQPLLCVYLLYFHCRHLYPPYGFVCVHIKKK